MIIEFTIPGVLRGKGRPRFVRGSGRVHTDHKTASTEAMVRQFAALAMRGKKPLIGPLRLSIALALNPPESWSQKKKASTFYVTGKPDCDNIIKLFDAGNGILWADDSQIAAIDFVRRYTKGQAEAHITVTQLEAA